MKEIEGAIAAVVDGDLDALPLIFAASQSDLLHAATNMRPLTISKGSLIRVLTAWCGGDSTANGVQQWASFVRRGYVSGEKIGELQPIDIVYDKKDEDLIVEIIGRLDEIGDAIDGEVDARERQGMLRILSA